MNSDLLLSLLQKHIPGPTVSYCFQLWQEHPFHFRLRKRRISKVGDFSCRPGKEPRITINQDSHPFVFLITYIHEVAHLIVHNELGWKAKAHGKKWKQTFRKLFAPLLRTDVFPEDLLTALSNHLRNPKASSFSDVPLNRMLRQYDQRLKSATLLSDIPEGSQFGIHGRWFTKGQKKRTRVVCRELITKRAFLIPVDALVDNNQIAFF